MSRQTKKPVTLAKRAMTDVEFMTHPDEWPRWPVLPVVRRGTQDAGLLWANRKPEVILDANLFALSELPGDSWADKLKGFEKKAYSSFEELLKEWRID